MRRHARPCLAGRRAMLGPLAAGLILSALAVLPVAAQDSPAASSTPSSEPSSQAPAQPSAKKVWTNDDIGSLRRDDAISTFREPRAPRDNPAAKPGAQGTKAAAWYRDRITQLQAQLPPIDEKIEQLQDALSGKMVNPVRTYGAHPDDWRVELDNLQKRRDTIQDRIATLRDQARHDGVPPNTLP